MTPFNRRRLAQRQGVRRPAMTVNEAAVQTFMSSDTLARADFMDMVANITTERSRMFSELMDPRRDIAKECGHPATDQVSPDMYRNLYDRHAIANRVTQVMSNEVWKSAPEVYEVEESGRTTVFEDAIKKLAKSLRNESWHQDEEASPIWEVLSRADELCGIGHFGVILLGLSDGCQLSEPVAGIDDMGRACNRKEVTELQFVDDDGNVMSEDEIVAKEEQEKAEKEAELMGAAATAHGKPPLPGQEPKPGQPPKPGESVTPSQGDTDEQEPPAPGAPKKAPPFVKNAFGKVPGVDDEDKGKPNNANVPKKGATGSEPTDPYDRYLEQGPDSQYGYQGFGAGISSAAEKGDDGCLKLLFLRAFDESLVNITQWDNRTNSPRYGQPVMYQITMTDPKESHPGTTNLDIGVHDVHWTRVIHIADNLTSSDSFGVPRMRPVLNHLLDLYKLYGGSAEMYWRGALPGLSLETHPELGGDVNIDEAKLKDKLENWANSLQRYFWTSGMTAKTLAPEVSDPTPQIERHLDAICVKLGVPKRIFMGSERGELASSQDDGSWNDRVRRKQNIHTTPRIIVPFFDRLIAVGVLPQPTGYSVAWPQLDALSAAEKATVAKTMTEAMAAYVSGGLESLMCPEDYLVNVMKYTAEEAESFLDNVKEAEPLDVGSNVPMFDEEGNEIDQNGNPLDPNTGLPMTTGPDGMPMEGGADAKAAGAQAGEAQEPKPGGAKPPAFGAKKPPKPGGNVPPQLARNAGSVVLFPKERYAALVSKLSDGAHRPEDVESVYLKAEGITVVSMKE